MDLLTSCKLINQLLVLLQVQMQSIWIQPRILWTDFHKFIRVWLFSLAELNTAILLLLNRCLKYQLLIKMLMNHIALSSSPGTIYKCTALFCLLLVPSLWQLHWLIYQTSKSTFWLNWRFQRNTYFLQVQFSWVFSFIIFLIRVL